MLLEELSEEEKRKRKERRERRKLAKSSQNQNGFVITDEWFRKNYDWVNAKYFGGKLYKYPALKITNSSSSIGQACCKFSRTDNSKRSVFVTPDCYYTFDLSIKFSKYFNAQSEDEYLNTLMHEMIHINQFQYDKIGTWKRNAHGYTFHEIAEKMNDDGYNIEATGSAKHEYGNDESLYIIFTKSENDPAKYKIWLVENPENMYRKYVYRVAFRHQNYNLYIARVNSEFLNYTTLKVHNNNFNFATYHLINKSQLEVGIMEGSVKITEKHVIANGEIVDTTNNLSKIDEKITLDKYVNIEPVSDDIVDITIA